VSHSYPTYFGFPGSDLNLDCGLRDHEVRIIKLYKEGKVMVNLDVDVVFKMSTTVVASNKVSQTTSLR